MTSSDTIQKVSVTVAQAPGAGEVDIENVTVSWIGEEDSYVYVYETAGAQAGSSGAGEQFGVEVV